MSEFFGTQAIFLTVSPCDECSFRIRLYATGKKHALPSLDCSDEECLADLNIQRNIHLQSPGACSLEYQSIIQIIVKEIIGWDKEKNIGTNGLFGIPIAYAITDEEQGRKTLHAHISIWIRSLNKLRKLLCSDDPVVEEKLKRR